MKRALGTHEIARICQVTPPTIIRWIEEGKLPFFKTGGGHHRVWDADLVDFLKAHNIPVPKELQSTGGPVVLIVDDEPDVRRVVTRQLKNAYPSVDIQHASDGFEAGHKITSLVPDLVILDIRLPGVDGYRVCRMVRFDEGLKRVKILAITGYNLDDARKQILEAGADDFLAKPFQAEELLKKVRKLLPNGASAAGDVRAAPPREEP